MDENECTAGLTQGQPDGEAHEAIPADDPRYELKTWHDLPMYQCRLCPASYMDLARFIDHYTNSHEPKARESLVLVADKRGREV